MARLAAQMDKGFYPLAPKAARMIGKLIEGGEHATIFDPCAGKGVALKLIADACGIPAGNIYASELDIARSDELANNLPESTVFGRIDFLASGKLGQASIVYCNPPFDDELGGGGRVEWRFIDSAIHRLKAGGLLVLVVPESTASHYKTFEILTSQMDNIEAFELPEDIRPFNEVVILGNRKKDRTNTSYTRLYQVTKEYSEIEKRSVPQGGAIKLYKQSYTDQELESLIESSPATKLFVPEEVPSRRIVSPPMELRKGHRAMLLASGYMDGVVTAPGHEPHVVRGTAVKRTETREEEIDGKIKVIETDRIYLVVKVATADGRIVHLTDQVKTDEAIEEGVEDA